MDFDYDPLSNLSELDQLIYQGLGAASMAWTPRPAGEFDSQLAKEIGEDLVAEVRRITGYQMDLVPPSRDPDEVEAWLRRP